MFSQIKRKAETFFETCEKHNILWRTGMEHTFGKKVKELRRSMKPTQKQLAGMVGVALQKHRKTNQASSSLPDEAWFAEL